MFKLWKQTTQKLGAHTGVLHDYTFEGPNNLRLAQAQFSVLVGRKVVTITYSDTQERMVKSRQQGLDMIASLKISVTGGEGFDRKEKLDGPEPRGRARRRSRSRRAKPIARPRGPVKG